MKIRVLAFATAASAVGSSELDIELPDGSDLGTLREHLIRTHSALEPIWSRLALAIDGQLVDARAALHDGAEVALLPPVSGGCPRRARITDEPIDIVAILGEAVPSGCGAAVLFVGTVRNHHAHREVLQITYEAYRPMAEAALETIAGELERRSEGLSVRIVHRLGTLSVGESSVLIATAAPHRASAYEASRLALERLKREVPIWKREWYADGGVAWREEEPLVPAADH